MEGKIMEKLQRFSIRKLSIGAVSCMIGTVTFLGYSNNVQAAEKPQTVETTKAENEIQPENTQESKPNKEAKGDTQNNAVDKDAARAQANNAAVVNASDQSKSEDSSAVASNSERNQLQTSQSADTTDVQPASDQVKGASINSNAPENAGSAASASTVLSKQPANADTQLAATVLSKQPANADTQLAATTSGVQPFMNLAVVSDNNDLTPKKETVDSTWTLHYVNQSDHKQELKNPTVITMQYTRTNTPQSDGTTKYGDWSYVPGSFKQTGTPITVKDSDNPVKQDNVDKNGENFDVFTITAMYPTVAGYGFYNGINGTRLHDNLRNNERQADSMSKDFYAEYDVAKPMSDTVTSKWTIHYVKYGDRQQELKAPTVITQQYTRTNTLQSNGKIQYGDWSYVPGSFKLTGTPITVNGSDNPTKEDNVDKDGKNYDVFSIIVSHPDITGYELHNAVSGVRISDLLQNDDSDGDILVMSPTMNNDRYVEYDVAKERSVAVKFVDDQSYDFNTSDHKKQVGQAITLTGRDGDTVDLNLTVPDKYQLAKGQQLPTTYTFTAGSGDVTIHLVHKVVQREATINFQLGLMTFVDFGDNSYEPAVITQAQWAQLEEEAKDGDGPVSPEGEIPFTEVGTLTGHVGYDLVDEEAVSFGDDWTSLNLGSRTYQLPNGTDVVNGILVDSDDTTGKKLKEYYLNEYQNWDSNKHVDPDYANRPWHGYLSVNATNNTQTPGADDVIRSGLQVGLAGDESNTLAKAIGDRAATAVEMANKTIDVNWLADNLDFGARDFKEQDGQLKAKTGWDAFGVYIPYVEKTATRTINITTPDGKTTTVKQTATLAKQVDFGKDAHPAWTTGEWTSYDVPTIPGYTVSQSQVAKEAVTGETTDQTVNITYTANDGTQTIVYQDEDGTPVHTTTVNGKTGQTVKVPNEVPTGWHIVNGKVPSEITFGPNGTPQTVVTIDHSHVTVTSDTPKTTDDKLPDNPDKTYPTGVSETDLNKTVTRTIKVTTPDGQTKTIAQTAKLTRTADVDEVTGEVKYSDWTTGEWANYVAPSVPGYTASRPYIAGQLVTGETTDQTIEITYTANDGTQTIVYQDEDGSEVGKQVVPGKTDEKVKVTPDVPDGYVLKGEVPSEVTIKPDDTPITVTVKHGKSHVTPDKPVNKGDLIPGTKDKHYPEGLTHNDLNKTVTREITITDPTGKKSTTTQTVTFTRGATVDEVTNKVTYGTWSENEKHIFDEVNVPYITGYRASEEVPEVTVTPDSKSTTIDIAYVAKTYDVYIFYQKVSTIYDNNSIDGSDDILNRKSFDRYANGELGIAKPEVLRGHYGESINIPIKQVQGYHVDPYRNYSNYKFGMDSITGQELSWYDFDFNNSKDLKDPLPEDASENEKENSMPRFIFVDYIKDHANSVYNNSGYNIGYVDTEGAVIGRPTNLRGVSGTDTNFTAPTFDGYTLTNPQDVPAKFGKVSQDIFLVYKPQDVKITYHYVDQTSKELAPSVAENNHFTGLIDVDKHAKQIDGYRLVSTPKERVVEGLKDLDLSFVYAAKDGTQTISYQDNGQEVGKQVITGKTDQTVKVTPEVPDGYVVKSEIPKEVTIKAKDETIVIAVEHGKAYISPDKPVNKGDLIEGTKDKHYPSGLTHDDLNKTITRKVTIIDPTGKKSTTTQTVTFTRGATVDDVTGKVTYGTWSEGGKHTFDKVDVPTVQGYTVSGEVPEVVVTPETQSSKVDLTYIANAQHMTITYVDDTTGETLKQDKLNGISDQDTKYTTVGSIKQYTDLHYKLVNDSTKGQDLIFDHDDNKDQAFEVHFVHDTRDISDKKSITETITYTMSDGSKAPDKVEKQIEFSRVGKHDDVTNTDTWDAWQPNKQSFSAVQTPDVTGYTPDIKLAEAKTVTAGDKDIAVTVTYSPDKQKAKVLFIDDTTKKTLDIHNLTGVTNGHEKYNPSEEIEKFIHENYVFVSSDYPEKGFTYDNDDNQDQVFEVHLKEVPIESDTPIVPDNNGDNGGSNGTPTDSDNPEKDNGESDTDKSSHKTPVKRHDNKKHHGTKKTNAQKNDNKTNSQKISKTAKLNPNRPAQPKLDKAKESTNSVNRIKHDALPQTGEKRSSLMAMLGLAISGLGMIGAMKSKKRKDD